MKGKIILFVYCVFFVVQSLVAPFFMKWYNIQLGVEMIPISVFVTFTLIFIGQIALIVYLGAKAFEETESKS